MTRYDPIPLMRTDVELYATACALADPKTRNPEAEVAEIARLLNGGKRPQAIGPGIGEPR